jgi:AraC family transcriptional regulator
MPDTVTHPLSAGEAIQGLRTRPRGAASPSSRAAQLLDEAIRFFDINRQAARTYLLDAALLLRADPVPEVEARPPNGFRPGGLRSWQVTRIIEYIESNLESRLQTAFIAQRLGLSRGHFARAFKVSFGMPLSEYIVTRRVERAKTLMRSTREPLSQIATACGFADQPHFNRSFRRFVGMSPGLWRRMYGAAPSEELAGSRDRRP